MVTCMQNINAEKLKLSYIHFLLVKRNQLSVLFFRLHLGLIETIRLMFRTVNTTLYDNNNNNYNNKNTIVVAFA